MKNTNRRPRTRRQQRKRMALILEFLTSVIIVLILAIVVRYFETGSRKNSQGLEAYKNGSYEQAVALFTEAVDADVKRVDFYVNLAIAQVDSGDPEAAFATLDKADQLSKSSDNQQLINRARGIAYLYSGRYSEAVDAFDAALKNSKSGSYSNNEIDILYYKGEAQDAMGSGVEAVLTYTEIINQEDAPEAYLFRGMEYQRVGDPTSAESDLRVAIAKSKKSYKAYMSLYTALMEQERNKEAKEVLNEALSLEVTNGDDMAFQGIIYLRLGNEAKAEEMLNRAVNKNSDNANYGLGELYKEKGEYETAKGYYEAYLEKVKTDASAYNQYGVTLIDLGDYKDALNAFLTGFSLNDRSVEKDLWMNIVASCEYLGQWDEANTQINAYLEKYPEDEDAVREQTFIQTRVQ